MTSPRTHQTLRFCGRLKQLLSAVVALATIAGSFRKADDFDLIAASHATNFAMFMAYTAMLYALYIIVCIELLGRVERMTLPVEIALDSTLAALLCIAGIVMATSDAMTKCEDYGDYVGLRCGSLKAGNVFLFLAMAAFLFTIVVNALAPPITTNTIPATPVNLEAAPQTVAYVANAKLSPLGEHSQRGYNY
ncbi:hypothetical protein ATCC90586_007065 [Pythium insidiosum]|nr:hypothetical protein ATCC90586_007065 [Pythium insidiosum]